MSSDIKSSYWYCDACDRNILHGEFRFNCTVCDNYDYCEQCAATADPPHPHRMVRELAFGQEESREFAKVDVATGIRAAIAMYCDRHCMGTRDVEKDNPSVYADSYSWLTYKTIGDRSKNFGHGLRRLIEPRGYLGICGANRPEWMITDFACIFQGIVSVPMYTLYNDRELAYGVNNTQVSVVVCDKQMLSRFIGIHSQCPSLQHIVCMDPPLSDAIYDVVDNGLSIHYMGDVEKNGSMKTYDYVTIEPDDCLTIIYTSGSSGFPKGVMLSERAFRAAFPRWCLPSSLERVILSYRPLAWGADRNAVITSFLGGGRTGFSTGDPSRLMEEIALVRPSYFGGPPGIWNKIYSEFKTALALISTQHSPETIADEEERLLQQFSKLMSNRCKAITIGGAMVSPAVLTFMKQCFTHCTVNESYGASECGGITYNNLVDDTVEYRLESVPHMGYTLDDQPFPRGELLTKTSQMFSGYINNPQETHAALTDDGFYRTGDIVELRKSRNGQTDLRIIDRKKNFFKLSQGQFVSPELLQSIYIQSPFVEQIYIHGDLLADSVSVVVVPNRKYAQVYAFEHHLTDFDMNNPHPQFSNAVLQDLRSIADREALRKHEIPSHIIIDFEPFTSENGLLTSSMKPCRPKLAAHYADRLNISNDIEQRLRTIMETVTGQSISTDKQENIFLSVGGGDSLSAVRLSRMIENDLGIPLPFHILFDPQMTLQQLTTLIQHPSHLSSFPQTIIPQLLNDSNIDMNITVDGCKSITTSPSMIFVTGTTGFVGAYLLAELLTTYSSECQFVCLVRCDLSTNPLDRIREKMLFYEIWKDEYEQRIIPLRGDLAQLHFGLDHRTYKSLNHQIDVIFHCGATVNFILPYSQLYGSNVCGTREMIRFATHLPSSCIPIQYISTISVLPPDVNKEISIDDTSPDRLVGGYAQSKWVAEKLMEKASRCGVPVVIYRLGLMCADSRSGACNPHDLYTLLFGGMMKMGCYPQSAIQCHFNGLAVDFTAKSLVYMSGIEGDVYGKVYHVINPDNEIGFEDIIDGMRRCGIEMNSVSNDEWKMTLKTMNDGNSALESVGNFFSNGIFRERSVVSADQFRNAVGTLDCPSFDRDYISKWLNFILQNLVRK